jgi:hypothetical protein
MMTRTLRWALAMTAWGIVVAVGVYAVTGNLGWAVVGLLLAGAVGNVVARPAARERKS